MNRIMMAAVVVAGLSVASTLTGCGDGGGGDGGGGGGGGGGSTPPVAASVVAQALALQSFTPAATTLNATAGQQIVLNGTTTGGLATPKCTWIQYVPVQAGVAVAQTNFLGVINGTCSSWTHNQTGTLNYQYTLVVNDGSTYLSQQWNINYQAAGGATTPSISAETPATGNVRVSSTKLFSVTVSDPSNVGTCSWKLDGIQVSTSCLSYSYTVAASGNHALVFSITDGVHAAATATWNVEPAATIASVSPSSSFTSANGSTTNIVTTLSDPYGSGGYCEYLLDGALAQARGSCTYAYHRVDNNDHTITVDVVYVANGTDRNGSPQSVATSLPNPPAVTMNTFTVAKNSIVHATKTANVAAFQVLTTTDTSGAATYTWYLNGIQTNCSSVCTYTDVNHTGIQFNNYDGNVYQIKVVFSNGVSSDTAQWYLYPDRSTINESVPPGTLCATGNRSFVIFGTGFEATDTLTLQNQNIALSIQQVSSSRVQVQVQGNVTPGTQAVKVVKSGVATQTGATYVTFTNAAQYCN